MTADISTSLRRLVIERAGERCEYCLIPQVASAFPHEPDHIIPLQHGGETDAANLALVRFYNPRADVWQDHFRLEGALILPMTPQARVTVKILRLNDAPRLEERERLIALELYP